MPNQKGQATKGGPELNPDSSELVVPNPNRKLMDQVREVLRVKHHAIRTFRELLGHKDVPTITPLEPRRIC